LNKFINLIVAAKDAAALNIQDSHFDSSTTEIESIIDGVRAKLIQENKEKERKFLDRSKNTPSTKMGESMDSILKEINDNIQGKYTAPSSPSSSLPFPGLRSQNIVFNDGNWYKSGYWKTKYLH
jgi:hypothetical protein